MKILAVQSRMGIGDTVIFLPFIKALSKKFNSPISILVKENSKANQYLHQTKYIDKILTLERDNKTNNRHGGFFGIFKLANDLKKYKFDKIFIFNSSLRFNLVAKISGIPQIYQYPLFAKNKQHIIEAPKKFLKKNLNLDINEDPEVQIDSNLISKAAQKFQIDKKERERFLKNVQSLKKLKAGQLDKLNIVVKKSKLKRNLKKGIF